MLIRIGYDIQFDVPASAPIVTLLHVHPSRDKDLIEPDALHIEPAGRRDRVHRRLRQSLHALRRPARPLAPAQLHAHSRHRTARTEVNLYAREVPVGDVPTEFLCYLLNSRYCEVDRFSNIAYELFGHLTARLVARAGHLRLGARQGHLQLSARPPHQDPRSTSTPSASAYAATFSTWPSPSAAP